GIGIFGLLNYSVTLRTYEIGVRGALGAGRAAVWRLILADTAVITAAGLIAGLVGSLGLMRLAQSVFYEVRTADPVALGSAVLCLLLVAIFAASLPAWRAAAIDPIRALRHE